MRKVLVIGIGAGNPEYVTVQAIKALHQVDVFFVMEKGPDKEDLVRLRKEVCQRYIHNRSYRIVEARDPERDRTASAYQSAVQAWYEKRADIYEQMIAEELRDNDCGAFLVWGNPSLYNSTLRIIDQIIARDTLAFEYEVIPGITSIQALAARHRIHFYSFGSDGNWYWRRHHTPLWTG